MSSNETCLIFVSPLTVNILSARDVGISIKWGAAWSEGDIRSYEGTAEDAMNAYVDLRRSQGRRPFIDAPHFELMT